MTVHQHTREKVTEENLQKCEACRETYSRNVIKWSRKTAKEIINPVKQRRTKREREGEKERQRKTERERGRERESHTWNCIILSWERQRYIRSVSLR